MYKNFKITEKERKQILESHKKYGYNKFVNEQEDMEDDFYGANVKIVIFSHLNDILMGAEDSKDRVNFIKVLIEKYMESPARVSDEELDNLWNSVKSGDYSGNSIKGNDDISM